MIVWKRAGAYDPCLGTPISWLATIARNRAIDWRRSQARRGIVPLDDAPDIPDRKADAETLMLLAETTLRVLSCLDELETRQRDAIRNAFYHRFTYTELAKRGRVPIGTMKVGYGAAFTKGSKRSKTKKPDALASRPETSRSSQCGISARSNYTPLSAIKLGISHPSHIYRFRNCLPADFYLEPLVRHLPYRKNGHQRSA